MPRYDYLCQDCGTAFEVRASMSDYREGLSPSCPECESSNAVRTLSAASVLTGSQTSGPPSGGCGSSGFG